MSKVLIQPNYNNAAVKLPSVTKTPDLIALYDPFKSLVTIELKPEITEGYCYMELIFGGELFAQLKMFPGTVEHFTLTPSEDTELVISGYYVTSYYKNNFNTFIKKITISAYSSDATACSENIVCTERG